MNNLQFLGIIIIVIGTFLPLVHVPVIGNWNYWKLNNVLAAVCWIFCAVALYGAFSGNPMIVKIFAVLLVVLFIFTIMAVKFQASSYFSFLPFKSWTETLAGTVKLKWGWIVEFMGGLILLIAAFKK